MSRGTPVSEARGGVDGGVGAQDGVVAVGFEPGDSKCSDEEGVEENSEGRMCCSLIWREGRGHMIAAESELEAGLVLERLAYILDGTGKAFGLLDLGQEEIVAVCSTWGPAASMMGSSKWWGLCWHSTDKKRAMKGLKRPQNLLNTFLPWHSCIDD